MPKPMLDKPQPESCEIKPDRTLEKKTRRTFTAAYKLKMINQADACQHGQLGALLRREKLYSNQLSQWRRELAEGGLSGLSKSAPGPAPQMTSEQRRIAQLEKQVNRLEKQIVLKDDCLELQKKALAMLDRLNSGIEQ